jgi:hypothetical protein
MQIPSRRKIYVDVSSGATCAPRLPPFWPEIDDLSQSCRQHLRKVRGEGGEIPVALELRCIVLNFDTQRFKELHILIADLEFRLRAEGRNQ